MLTSGLKLHIWQLSEKTIVASVHVLVARDIDYMEVASGIRKALHEHGVHSSTIQPEFGDEADDVSVRTISSVSPHSGTNARVWNEQETACLIRCPPETCAPEACCPPIATLVDVDGNPSEGQDAQQPTGENMV
jgi:zinc transporter 1